MLGTANISRSALRTALEQQVSTSRQAQLLRRPTGAGPVTPNTCIPHPRGRTKVPARAWRVALCVLVLAGAVPVVRAATPTGDPRATVETDPVLSDQRRGRRRRHLAASPRPGLCRWSSGPTSAAGAVEVYDMAGRRLQRITGGAGQRRRHPPAASPSAAGRSTWWRWRRRRRPLLPGRPRRPRASCRCPSAETAPGCAPTASAFTAAPSRAGSSCSASACPASSTRPRS